MYSPEGRPSGSSHSSMSSSDEGSSSREQKNRTSQISLPECVSKWSRQHAERHLNIFYSKEYIEHPEDLMKKVSGTVKELTEEQKMYIDYVNKHLKFTSSLSSFHQQSTLVQETLRTLVEEVGDVHETEKSLWSFRLQSFVMGIQDLFNNIGKYSRKPQLYEGVTIGFLADFAGLCCLRVQHCFGNKALQTVWENLKGVQVTSLPDLRLYRCGLEHKHSTMMVSVAEVKPDSRSISQEPDEPPRKLFRGSTKFYDNPATEDSIIEAHLHDKVLGQHAGELLLDLHNEYKNDEVLQKKDILTMSGIILDGTKVFFTLLEISKKHYEKLVKNECLNADDRATIYYSKSKDILLEVERKSLIEDFMRLNNIEY